MSGNDSPSSPPLKRKREEAEDDLEIDLALPEPLSKKEARKAKKRKDKPATDAETTSNGDHGEDGNNVAITNPKDSEGKLAKRSDYGIWIGNLPFAVTKLDIRQFLCKDTEIKDEEITRVHMPAPNAKGNDRNGPPAANKPKNKGFAYVDFTTADVLAKALELSEKLLLGRRVLIKNARSFEGRPAVDPVANSEKAGKPPSKRVFLGNLSFSVDAEQLKQHFSQCGEVVDIHVATFEDSGKCKGYAWITFDDIEAAVAAVRGFVQISNGEESTSQKRRAVDRIEGRVLRREFAEDKSVRYSKRFGKGAKREDQDGAAESADTGAQAAQDPAQDDRVSGSGSTAHDRRREKRQAGKTGHAGQAKQKYIPHDTRPRPSKATGSIPAGQSVGTKVSFD